jgi:hypothetical protein
MFPIPPAGRQLPDDRGSSGSGGASPTVPLADTDAAAAGLGVVPGLDARHLHALDEALDELEVHAADEIALLLGDGVKGAVLENDGVIVDAGLVALSPQRSGDVIEVGPPPLR